jgi:hypothetical protein
VFAKSETCSGIWWDGGWAVRDLPCSVAGSCAGFLRRWIGILGYFTDRVLIATGLKIGDERGDGNESAVKCQVSGSGTHMGVALLMLT